MTQIDCLINEVFSGAVIKREISLTGQKDGTNCCFRFASLRLFFIKTKKDLFYVMHI